MENIKSSKLEVLIDNFINRYSVSGSFSKSDFEELLARAMLSDNKDLKRVSCKIIRRLRLKNLIGYVRALLNDEDPIIRSLSLLAIAQFKDEQSLDKVVELYYSDNKMVKSSSILALGSIDKPENYGLIFRALDDDVDDVRENAIIALSWINYYKNVSKLLEMYDIEKNRNIKNRIIKAFSILSSDEINRKLEEIVINEQDDIIVLSAINSLYKKGITKYTILANTILLKAMNDIHRNKKPIDLYRKNLYNIVAHNLWEIKSINNEDQSNIYRIMEDDLVYKYYVRSDEVRKLAISALKNLNFNYHQLVIKLFDNDLSNLLKLELINFLSNSKVDKNLKLLLLEFLIDNDKVVREQALFAILDSQLVKAMVSHINERIFSMEYSYLKLIALAIIYSSIDTFKV
ncbi:MAG: HEAT repeat domain-containing protein [bacterium]|nr:HEAT repeat domain-containing protein [bacterium]